MDATLSTPASSALGTPGRRRNGRLQACEPCRRRKVSCDHAYPVCRRCVARKKPDGCVYIAPQKTAAGPRTQRPAAAAEAGLVRDTGSISVISPSTVTPNGPNTTSTSESTEHRAGLPPETSPGYLGFTSFSAVYQETQNSLSLVQGASILSSMRTPSSLPGTNPAASSTTPTLSPSTLETCLFVLRRIPGEDVALSLFQKHVNPNDGWLRSAAEHLIKSLSTAFGRELRSRRPADLEAMAQVLSTNTARVWMDDQPDAQQWLESFSGRNMRWECIGILFTYWGLASFSVTPQQLDIAATVYKEAAEKCIELCRGCAPNTLLLYLIHKDAIIESMQSGDASPTFWRRLGDDVATATYLGLHAITQDGDYVPTVASEVKRRMISQIFVVDKVAASFSGRPPLLSRKYMTTPLPLDLSDEVLMADAATITRAVEDLDENGWNKKEVFQPSVIVRARRMLMTIKDEIIELALGNPIYSSTEALLELREQENEVFSRFPTSLKYDAGHVRDLSVPGTRLYTELIIYLEHLQNLFFIDRLLVQRGHDRNADLLSVSFDMVSTTLVFWMHVDRLVAVSDFEWLVMAYAAPAGGILCNELLKPTLHLAPVEGVTKSGIVQKLSLLIGFLSWVGPSAPNGHLCASCKTVIEHVLEHFVNGAPASSTSNGAADQVLDFNPTFGADMDGFFNFELLDTFDWMRSEIPSSQQSQLR